MFPENQLGYFLMKIPQLFLCPFLELQINHVNKMKVIKMGNETMRIFFPLKIVNYPQYDCSEDEREDISPREAVAYENQILAASPRRTGTLKMIVVLPSTFTTMLSRKRCIARTHRWRSSMESCGES